VTNSVSTLPDADRAPNELHQPGHAATRWTTVNIGEAMPGVQTPLSWDLWGGPADLATRAAFADMGVFARSEVRPPEDPDARLLSIFFGRAALNVDQLRRTADRTPGTSGAAFERDVLGGTDVEPSPRAFHPLVSARIAVTAPATLVRFGSRLSRLHTETLDWWRSATTLDAEAGLPAASAGLASAARQFQTVFQVHTLGRLIAQSLYEQVAALARAAGKPGFETGVLAGSGDSEDARMVRELWEVAHGRRALPEFLVTHGYHGPDEGTLSSFAWRERPEPLTALLPAYRAMDASADPASVHRRAAARRDECERELLAALRAPRRPAARAVIRLARAYAGYNELGKTSYLRALDGARAAARAAGAALVRAGELAEVDDVFYLTLAELSAPENLDLPALVEQRRARRERYQACELPKLWTGSPEPVFAEPARTDVAASPEDAGPIRGIGASPGAVEGRARVVPDAAHVDDLEPDEIMVCPFTDPGWASAFFLAAGLVIDLGGPMSHGAIIAREMGLPCVINTGSGTRRIQTGDLIRIDGERGTVDVLEPAAPPTAPLTAVETAERS
jgi:phosphohistidine swiveling domain-containing protein